MRQYHDLLQSYRHGIEEVEGPSRRVLRAAQMVDATVADVELPHAVHELPLGAPGPLSLLIQDPAAGQPPAGAGLSARPVMHW